MKRKFSITVIIFFSAFMLNVSAMAFQQRYDRRDDEDVYDPNVIEMNDAQVFQYLRNTWFFELPPEGPGTRTNIMFFVEEAGFGQRYAFQDDTFKCCHLKFVLINYLGFFTTELPENTWVQSFL